MSSLQIENTNFIAGELSPLLYGRTDLQAYQKGCASLTNVLIQSTGGLVRRPGLRFVARLPGAGRLACIQLTGDQIYIFVFTHYRIFVFHRNILTYEMISPWSLEQLSQLSWTQSENSMLVVHPDTAPQVITRRDTGDWERSDFLFGADSTGRIFQPHHKFVDEHIALSPSNTIGVVTISCTPGAYPFHVFHQGCRIRIDNSELLVVAVPGTGGIADANNPNWYNKADALVIESLSSIAFTENWSEQAFSNVRGFPVCMAFHQGRLVIGGSRELPNRIWLSRTGNVRNFDLGEGLDDEAIEFAILSNEFNAVRAVFPGRHLQVFTSGGEWMVSGEPLTPTSIQLFEQTRVGSSIKKNIPPKDVDGATIFIPGNEHQIRQFVFTDIEQAYQSADLALLSEHIVEGPLEMDYDAKRRLLYVVMKNGKLATLTIYRGENVYAWSKQETAGMFIAVSVAGEDVYAMVERNGNYSIEVFDWRLNVDAGSTKYAEALRKEWDGFEHLDGRTISVVADGTVLESIRVENGRIDLPKLANSIQAGIPYVHTVEPLPPSIPGVGSSIGRRCRPVRITFRVVNTCNVKVDTGYGLVDIPLERFGERRTDGTPKGLTGEVTVRASGWRKGSGLALWRVSQDTPLPFNLLSVTCEIGVGD